MVVGNAKTVCGGLKASDSIYILMLWLENVYAKENLSA